ncbi:uncharacterized protein LOC119732627 isoform X3 [Patiria miniata]|uniref:Uncharacterized protein n=1 Tax=Patiria miniata TaxID=46514 RepID=A0A914AEL8_PATMI|nr:uncharacterized protein LOC119732627 isoform X3 [Patiria miniata]
MRAADICSLRMMRFKLPQMRSLLETRRKVAMNQQLQGNPIVQSKLMMSGRNPIYSTPSFMQQQLVLPWSHEGSRYMQSQNDEVQTTTDEKLTGDKKESSDEPTTSGESDRPIQADDVWQEPHLLNSILHATDNWSYLGHMRAADSCSLRIMRYKLPQMRSLLETRRKVVMNQQLQGNPIVQSKVMGYHYCNNKDDTQLMMSGRNPIYSTPSFMQRTTGLTLVT